MLYFYSSAHSIGVRNPTEFLNKNERSIKCYSILLFLGLMEVIAECFSKWKSHLLILYPGWCNCVTICKKNTWQNSTDWHDKNFQQSGI